MTAAVSARLSIHWSALGDVSHPAIVLRDRHYIRRRNNSQCPHTVVSKSSGSFSSRYTRHQRICANDRSSDRAATL